MQSQNKFLLNVKKNIHRAAHMPMPSHNNITKNPDGPSEMYQELDGKGS